MIPKKYLHDRSVLLLVSVNVFLTLFLAIWIAIRLSTGHNSYIVQYRSGVGVDAFRSGGVSELIGFIVFGFLTLAANLSLSIRAYRIHKQLSITILGLGVLLLVLAIIVSNALLVLR